jgi:hypothetical protein
MTEAAPLLVRLRAAEARLIARRAGPPAPEAAVAEALVEACGGDAVPPGYAAAGQAIAASVEAHGASFAAGAEPDYHDRHHQAEAALCAGWLAGEARRAGLFDVRTAGLLVLAMAGHDLLHDGRAGEGRPVGALERRSAEATDRLAAAHLPPPDRAEIIRLILVTIPGAPAPGDLAAQMVREADLFGSLTPSLGWRLSRALAQELERAGEAPEASARVASHAGRLALLTMLPAMSPAAVALGLAASRSAQIAALGAAGGGATPEQGAALLDGLAPEEGMRRWKAALRGLGMPELPP